MSAKLRRPGFSQHWLQSKSWIAKLCPMCVVSTSKAFSKVFSEEIADSLSIRNSISAFRAKWKEGKSFHNLDQPGNCWDLKAYGNFSHRCECCRIPPAHACAPVFTFDRIALQTCPLRPSLVTTPVLFQGVATDWSQTLSLFTVNNYYISGLCALQLIERCELELVGWLVYGSRYCTVQK